MDSGFISIAQRLVSEQDKNALLDPKQYKAFLGDYAKGEFKKERHLLIVAIEAGAAKEIANATDLETCKKIQARLLKDERFIDETAACEIVDLLAFVLRGDNSQSIATPPSSQYASPSTSQSRYAQPQTNANAQNTGVNNASGWISNAAKTIITVIIAIAVGIVVGAIAVFVICCISFLIAGGERIDNLWSSNYDYHSYKIIDHAKKIAAVCGAIGGFIVWLITFYKVNKKLLPKATKDWIKNWRN